MTGPHRVYTPRHRDWFTILFTIVLWGALLLIVCGLAGLFYIFVLYSPDPSYVIGRCPMVEPLR